MFVWKFDRCDPNILIYIYTFFTYIYIYIYVYVFYSSLCTVMLYLEFRRVTIPFLFVSDKPDDSICSPSMKKRVLAFSDYSCIINTREVVVPDVSEYHSNDTKT